MTAAFEKIIPMSCAISGEWQLRVVVEIVSPNPMGSASSSGETPQDLRPMQRQMERREAIGWLEREIESRPAPDMSFLLLDSAEVSRRMSQAGFDPLRGRAINLMLKEAGFRRLGLIRVRNKTANYWSIYPEKFRAQNGMLQTSIIRDILDPL